jgi:carboxyl-terminal processing protease
MANPKLTQRRKEQQIHPTPVPNTHRPTSEGRWFGHSLHSVSKVGSKLAVSLAAFLMTNSAPGLSAPVALTDSPRAVLDEAWQIVNQSYVDPQFNHVDWLNVRQQLLSRSYSSREAAYAALKDALKKLNDPYTRFLDPQEFQSLNHQDIDGELFGVGVQLEQEPRTHHLRVVKTLAQSPASQAGVKAGDIVLEIEGRNTKGMSVNTAAQLIRGAANTSVKLLLSHPAQAPFRLALTRQKLTLPIVYSAVRQEGNQRIGYIRLEEFNGHSAEQMKQAITDLNRQNVDRFVLDLRSNPGGLLDQETEIARMWLDQGAIVQIVDRDKASTKIAANHTALTHRPLAVLVDGQSASASEILTGALKDNHRAVVIGTQTFGKGLVQSVNPLSDGSGINVTIAHYLTPSGLDINHRGITPDVVAPLSEQKYRELFSHPNELGTPQDPQYEQAVRIGTGDPRG